MGRRPEPEPLNPYRGLENYLYLPFFLDFEGGGGPYYNYGVMDPKALFYSQGAYIRPES